MPRPIRIRMARDVATMFDELRAMADRHAELHADAGAGFRRSWNRRGGRGGGGC